MLLTFLQTVKTILARKNYISQATMAQAQHEFRFSEEDELIGIKTAINF